MTPTGKLQDLVLVTGAGGFIGSHLVTRALSENVKLRCFRHSENAESILSAMQDVTTVFHLGGMASAALAETSPDKAFRANTVTTQTLMEAARVSGVTRVVLLSTAHVYGLPRNLPVTEDHPLAPLSMYAATKLAADTIALAYGRSYGIGVNILRPFNVYGPRQTANAILPTILAQALSGKPVHVQDLRPKRDFLFVDDVVDALLRAATVSVTGQEIILASGRPVSVAALIREIAQSEEPGDPPDEGDCLFGSPDRAHRVLGWRPEVSLATGVARTIDWWRRNMLQS